MDGYHDADLVFETPADTGVGYSGAMDPLVAVLLAAAAFQTVSTIGFDAIADRVLALNALKADILGTKREITRTSAQARTPPPAAARSIRRAATSSQDEFAKWAKLRRKYDKLISEFEQKSRAHASRKKAFKLSVSWGLWALFWILQIAFIVIWRAHPMFYVPRDWVGPFTRWLRFPLAPPGSVSVLYWFYACRSMFARIALMLSPRPAVAQAKPPHQAHHDAATPAHS
ncbi:GET complex subunit get1 [Polyrhizophydium stewartii]|uniref:GET complex subunit get1 n=1 Tax=Polyrhizophydium stewartii TaxID=2732419 RepID=A0ABR4MY55_9FUNG